MAATAVAESGGRKRRDGAGSRSPDSGRPRRTDREGVIDIAFGCRARVRLRGEVSSETLRRVIGLLR
jgi:hypothetical protein